MSTLGIIVLIIISVLLGFFINAVIYHAKRNIKVGAPAPGFQLELLDGTKIGHADWDRPPHPVMLCFVSPRCSACRTMAPILDELAKKYAHAKIDVILHGINGSRKEFETWKRELKLSLPVALDPADVTRMKYAVYSLPSIYFISSGGLVRYIHHGFRPSDEKVLEKMFIERLKRMELRKKGLHPDRDRVMV